MVRNDKPASNEENDGITDRSRRNLLKITGAGAGLATLGGFSMTGAGQEDEPTPTDDDDSDASDHFIADIVDPVFGYPLAQGETEDLSVEHVVDAMVEEGTGEHENFPAEPDEEAPGELLEIPVEFMFDPVGLHVEPSEVVHFNDVSGLHTVTAFHDKFVDGELVIPNRVPEDVPGFTSPPMMPGESWVYQFTEKGVYDYFCFPHLGLGMVGRIVVFDPEEDDLESEEFSAPSGEGLFPNDERVLSAEELQPANIVEQGSVSWADLTIPEQSSEEETETEEES